MDGAVAEGKAMDTVAELWRQSEEWRVGGVSGGAEGLVSMIME